MAQQVTAPQRHPRVGGIKEVTGEFVIEPRLAVVNASGGLVWEDSTCGFPSLTRAGCYDDAIPSAPKSADGITQFTTIGDPFAQYRGVECYIGGDADTASYEEQARQALAAGEDRAVEILLASWAMGDSVTNLPSIPEAIAAAESIARDGYVGQPVMLMGARTADEAFAAHALVREGGRLVTGLGTPVVVVTGGMPYGDVAAIGWPTVWASPVVAATALAHTDNLAMAIAERVYAIGVDCDYRAGTRVVAP